MEWYKEEETEEDKDDIKLIDNIKVNDKYVDVKRLANDKENRRSKT